jgi:hypothetical protein
MESNPLAMHDRNELDDRMEIVDGLRAKRRPAAQRCRVMSTCLLHITDSGCVPADCSLNGCLHVVSGPSAVHSR